MSTDAGADSEGLESGIPTTESQQPHKSRVALQRVGGGQDENGSSQQISRRVESTSGGVTRRTTAATTSARGGSTAAGNFVVFQEDAVDVKRRNGDVAISGAAGEAWESFAPEKVKTKENDGNYSVPCYPDPKLLCCSISIPMI